jgi:hypothetical protein
MIVAVAVAVIAAAAATCFTLVSSLAYSSILKLEAICFSETSVNFSRLHGVIFHKIELLKWKDVSPGLK